MERLPNYLFKPTVAEKPSFAEGDRVRVHAGALEGVEGTVVAYCTASRLIIAVDLNCHGVTLEIDQERLDLSPPRSSTSTCRC